MRKSLHNKMMKCKDMGGILLTGHTIADIMVLTNMHYKSSLAGTFS